MGCGNLTSTLAGALISVVVVGAAAGWEIRLKGEVATAAAVVRLGDVAELGGLESGVAKPLQRIVVAPGPLRSRSRLLTVSDLRSVLTARGVDLSGCSFSGAPQVLVTLPDNQSVTRRSVASDVQPTAYRSVSGGPQADRLVAQVAELARQQLQQLSGDAVPWSVTVSLPPRTDVKLSPQWSELVVDGIVQPHEGTHELTVSVSSNGARLCIPVEARARRMRPVVVPVHDVERGRVLRAGDVQLSYVDDGTPASRGYSRLEQVVGRQTRQAVKAGRPLDTTSVVEPLLIKRRDTIEVVNINGAITIRRPALALEDGAQGDTISVETLDGSKVQFIARVIGVKLAEVAAITPRVERHAGALQ